MLRLRFTIKNLGFFSGSRVCTLLLWSLWGVTLSSLAQQFHFSGLPWDNTLVVLTVPEKGGTFKAPWMRSGGTKSYYQRRGSSTTVDPWSAKVVIHLTCHWSNSVIYLWFILSFCNLWLKYNRYYAPVITWGLCREMSCLWNYEVSHLASEFSVIPGGEMLSALKLYLGSAEGRNIFLLLLWSPAASAVCLNKSNSSKFNFLLRKKCKGNFSRVAPHYSFLI